jgi:hypothetical protein
MRRDLIRILRDIERIEKCRNHYEDSDEKYCEGQTVYIAEYIDFPNYRFVISKYNELLPSKKDLIASNSIKSELKRMELDGLIAIDLQEGIKNVTIEPNGPYPEDDRPFKTESIILTTMGKSRFRYYAHKVKVNLITLIISILALGFSIS